MLVKKKEYFISCTSVSGFTPDKVSHSFLCEPVKSSTFMNTFVFPVIKIIIYIKYGRLLFVRIFAWKTSILCRCTPFMLILTICSSFKSYFPVKYSLFSCPKSS